MKKVETSQKLSYLPAFLIKTKLILNASAAFREKPERVRKMLVPVGPFMAA